MASSAHQLLALTPTNPEHGHGDPETSRHRRSTHLHGSPESPSVPDAAPRCYTQEGTLRSTTQATPWRAAPDTHETPSTNLHLPSQAPRTLPAWVAAPQASSGVPRPPPGRPRAQHRCPLATTLQVTRGPRQCRHERTEAWQRLAAPRGPEASGVLRAPGTPASPATTASMATRERGEEQHRGIHPEDTGTAGPEGAPR